jgi:hypothetical protein
VDLARIGWSAKQVTRESTGANAVQFTPTLYFASNVVIFHPASMVIAVTSSPLKDTRESVTALLWLGKSMVGAYAIDAEDVFLVWFFQYFATTGRVTSSTANHPCGSLQTTSSPGARVISTHRNPEPLPWHRDEGEKGRVYTKHNCPSRKRDSFILPYTYLLCSCYDLHGRSHGSRNPGALPRSMVSCFASRNRQTGDLPLDELLSKIHRNC